MSAPLHVIFACVRNAGRSQIAAALFERFADPAKARASSAGTKPAERVHPEVVATLREVGVDVARRVPRKLTPELARTASWLITMGCGDECPVVPGAQRDDWPIDDPAGQPPERVRAIRDEIERRVRVFVSEQRWARASAPAP